MRGPTTALTRGLVAGAAGTTALNAATYLDMVLRGRPASSTPETTVDRVADLLHVDIPGDDEQRDARRTALGSLLGSAAGVGAGAVLGAIRATGHPRGTAGTLALSWVLAMIAGNGPMTALGITDPRAWTAKDWAADVVPHLAFAVAATVTLRPWPSER
ncbi:hypothetical protein [Georgenia ruanii]|uniref:DUF1440 domain-containing protein n=1 Tax=Georgenia ruanii TaxID=348442 RepID=A0A7J9UYZ4_9MICO|nr:hypothetical protein [Georgenia ruanii]MPV88904.1 hypothetical protein [Georgenia ruanii]